MKERERETARALAVIVQDPKICAYLLAHDPKALQQAQTALLPYGWPGPMPDLTE